MKRRLISAPKKQSSPELKTSSAASNQGSDAAYFFANKFFQNEKFFI